VIRPWSQHRPSFPCPPIPNRHSTIPNTESNEPTAICFPFVCIMLNISITSVFVLFCFNYCKLIVSGF
jgi:hypothetical protein